MIQMNEFDALRNEDWSNVYGTVPESVNAGVEFAFARIRAREKRRRVALRALACAACFALVVGMASLNLRRPADAPDRVASPAPELKLLTDESIVYAAMADAYFHVRSDCSGAMAEQVELPLITALEFEKEICPVCGADVRLPG